VAKLDRFNWALDWFDQIAARTRRNQDSAMGGL
jgi:hypothetical protein